MYDMSEEDIEDLIENFLLDKDFEILEEKLNKFNLFTVLNVSNNFSITLGTAANPWGLTSFIFSPTVSMLSA